MGPLSSAYAAAARYRRRWYAAHPDRRRRLSQPVISIGNIALGGRAKTPLAASIAQMLLEAGERPAILSRGYARRRADEEVVVVRDPSGIRADVDRAGDEPLMLARRLHGATIVIGADRYRAGRLAEERFGCTVHILDDGFQHVTLDRDVDVVAVARADLDRHTTLPLGRLREPLDALAAADALIALDDAPVQGLAYGRPVWRARRTLEPARLVEPFGAEARPTGAVVAVAGIAHPQHFFEDLRAAGWRIARELPFRDHHRFSARDVDSICAVARTEGADLVVTTEKDLVRLLPYRPFPIAVAWVPMAIHIDPPDTFGSWLSDALTRARDARR